MFRKCPSYHKKHSSQEPIRKQVTTEVYHAHVGGFMGPFGMGGVGPNIDKFKMHYKVAYKYCSHEWNDYVVKSINGSVWPEMTSLWLKFNT